MNKELELPLSPDQVASFPELPPRFRQLLTLEPKAIKRELREIWSEARTEGVRTLAARILRATPQSALIFERGAALRLYEEKKEVNGALVPNDFWIFAPLARETVEERVQTLGLKRQGSLVDFLTFFHSLSDGCGAFLAPHSPERFGEGDYEEEFDGFDKWKEAIKLYGCNGDEVLLRKDGRLAWKQLETQSVVPITGSFSQFLEEYTAHLNRFRPYDSWAE